MIPVDTPDTLCLQCRSRTLSFMAALCVATEEFRSAEGYLLELLAWCSFAERTSHQVAEA